MSDVTITVDTFTVSLQEAERVLPKAEAAALRKVAGEVRKLTKRNLTSRLPNSRKPNEKYVDTLYDAPRVTKVRDGEIKVHIMGTQSKGSGTFRTRFFEGGTKDRYVKTRNGIPLRKQAYRGSIKPLNFFNDAKNSINPTQIMEDTINKYIQKAWK